MRGSVSVNRRVKVCASVSHMGMSVSTAVCKRVTHGHASGSLWEQREHQAGVFRECGGCSGAKTIISADAEWSRLCWRLEGDNPGNTTTLQAPANPSAEQSGVRTQKHIHVCRAGQWGPSSEERAIVRVVGIYGSSRSHFSQVHDILSVKV